MIIILHLYIFFIELKWKQIKNTENYVSIKHTTKQQQNS